MPCSINIRCRPTPRMTGKKKYIVQTEQMVVTDEDGAKILLVTDEDGTKRLIVTE